MLKICLVIPTLQPGGMERVMSELAGYFAEKPDTKIDLVLYGRNRTVFYELPDKVAIHRPDFIFDNSKRTLHTIKTLFFLRRKISRIRPDIVLSFGEYWNSFVLLSLLGKKVPVVVSDRCSPDKNLGSLHERLRRWIYPKAAAVIAQTSKASKIYKEKGLNKSIPVIGNPIREIQNEADGESARENVVLTVGRLIETKHHDRLIRIFSEIGNRDWKLVIVGDNALKQDGMTRLQRLISELDLEGRVILTGNVKDVDEYYLKSKIFAFTSSSEGFPNVIGEALSAGLPVVSYNCSAGPKDMISDGENGFLVEPFSDSEFAEKLQMLMVNEALWSDMKEQAHGAVEKFSIARIGEAYNELLEEVNFNTDKQTLLTYKRKVIRFSRFIKHSFFYLIRKKIGRFRPPEKPVSEIGFFDKNELVHVKNEYRHYFREENLYKNGEFQDFKKGIISLVYDGEEVLIRKSFHGFRKYEKFYNELFCEIQLKKTGVKPGIKYVDYDNLQVYIKYVGGLVLSSRRIADVRKLEQGKKRKYASSILNGIEKIHQAGIIQYDVGGRNIIANGDKCWFIDFSDSIYFKNKDNLFELLKQEEQNKLARTLRILN